MLSTLQTGMPATAERAGSRIGNVAICVVTYRRPEGLRKLLQGIERLEFQEPFVPSLQVVVVDNDPQSEMAIKVCRKFSTFRCNIRVVAEERCGISHARNAAVQEAFALGADAIAFIDDDEVPDPRWLDELLGAQQSSGAEAVCGPVLPHFEEPPPAWMIKGKFFDRPRYPTGSVIKLARTGNILLVAHFLKDSGLRFDERFGQSGGEDTLLTLQFQKRGGRIIWADQAIVRETVPRDRANANYILHRAYFTGSSWARIEPLVNPSPWVRVRRAAGATRRICWHSLLIAPSLVIGRHAVMSCAAEIWRGVGQFSGVFGHRPKVYG